MNNYERITSMSLEELANRFIPLNRNGYLGLDGQIYKLRDEAVMANIKYLQVESEERE